MLQYRYELKKILVINYTISKSQFLNFQKPTPPKIKKVTFLGHIKIVVLCKTKHGRPKFKNNIRSRNKQNRYL